MPPALLNNTEYNHVVHEQVVLVRVETADVPHVPESDRLTVEFLRLGFVTVNMRYGYQDEPDVVHALALASRYGLDIDLDALAFYVDHASIVPTGDHPVAGWRKRLFVLLHQNRRRWRARTAFLPTASSRSGRSSSCEPRWGPRGASPTEGLAHYEGADDRLFEGRDRTLVVELPDVVGTD